ncbi:FxsB family cyclophane-forming radical SAM/SPASM peptide maturase [Streptomyces sp. NPDC127098]|uniref:FxsB family cyclophane-forming radical SAM/SPASM peptide maturase n=1 Tax=Streptomyces sp. NPDC127098 TaxID=3347137 RepID=UPI00365FA10B
MEETRARTRLPVVRVNERAGEWPTPDVTEQALADPSWRPLPFVEFALKFHGRCNLACDYCYMYEMADQSWRDKPVAMSRRTIDQVAHRIGEHLSAHAAEVGGASVRMHGGEALLAGADQFAYAARALRAAMPPGLPLKLVTTTNGILLDDDRMLETLREHEIGVTVSLDGDREAQDRHRRYANGRGSHDLVMRGVEALNRPDYRHLFEMVLCTVDLDNDPLTTYEALLATGAPAVDFLLPLGNWSSPPPGWTAGEGGTAYADWLIPIFDRWYGTVPVPAGVRLFENIMAMSLGGRSRSEAVGLLPFQLLVIESDGSIELGDALKSAYEGAPHTGLDVFRDSFDEARLLPGVVARQRGAAGLSPTCAGCAVRDICGAGEYSTRYRADAGFRNPSVYCADLARLVCHIRDRVLADVARLRDHRTVTESDHTA